MYGVILFWRVKPGCLAEHDEIMREALEAERERCPELLLNLPFGPSADGTFGAVQVYADEATYHAFPERVRREDARLWELWGLSDAISEPTAAQTLRFEEMGFLDEGFVRAPAGVGHVELPGGIGTCRHGSSS
jgi:hypothetical protein